MFCAVVKLLQLCKWVILPLVFCFTLYIINLKCYSITEFDQDYVFIIDQYFIITIYIVTDYMHCAVVKLLQVCKWVILPLVFCLHCISWFKMFLNDRIWSQIDYYYSIFYYYYIHSNRICNVQWSNSCNYASGWYFLMYSVYIVYYNFKMFLSDCIWSQLCFYYYSIFYYSYNDIVTEYVAVFRA